MLGLLGKTNQENSRAHKCTFLPGLPPNDCLVDQTLHFLLACLAMLVCFEQNSDNRSKLRASSWEDNVVCLFCARLLLQCLQNALPRQRKSQCISTGSEAMMRHVRCLVHCRRFVAMTHFHGHAHKRCDARTCADQLHHSDLLCVDSLRSKACPHVVGQRQRRQCPRFQSVVAAGAQWDFAIRAQDSFVHVCWMASAPVVLPT